MICAWCGASKPGMAESHGMCADCYQREIARYRRKKMYANDPNAVDRPTYETIDEVREWYRDEYNLGLPPGVVWVSRIDEIIQLPHSGEFWQWDYDLGDWVEVHQ